MAQTNIKRTGVTNIPLMLMAKDFPKNWTVNTLLALMEEKNGTRTIFQVTDEAIENLKLCEEGRIYDVTIPGKFVRLVSGIAKYGQRTTQEVKTKVELKIELSKEAWPSTYEYKCLDWNALNQQSDGNFIDIIGRVPQNPERDLTSAIPKMIVTLENGDFTTTVDFLSKHANQVIKKDDVILLGGIRVTEFKNVRSLRTSWLTTVEINPEKRPNIPSVQANGDDEPKKKAIRVSQQNVCTVNELKVMESKMELDAQDGNDVKEKIVTVTGELLPFNDVFFTGQAPIVGDDIERMCLRMDIKDATGTTAIKVWDKAAFQLLGMTAPRLREFWETGVEDPDQQEGVLETLNERVALGEVRIVATVKIWSFGFKEAKYEAQANVDYLEFI